MICRVWYTEDREYDVSGVEDWKALPETGLLWAAIVRDTGVTHYNGGDWYFILSEEILYVPAAPWGQHSPKPRHGCLDCIKRGDGVRDEEFERVGDDAREWGRTQWEALRGH